MTKIKVGINGFGRIGRIASRIILDNPNLELLAINSRAESSSHAYLLKYDSTYGIFDKDIKAEDQYLKVDGEKITVLNYQTPGEIPWNDFDIDVVIDSTGKFRTKKDLQGHLKKGVKSVILSAPAKDDIKTIVMGVNHESYNQNSDKIVSNSSCTTNCLATTLKVLNDAFKVKQGFMTTTHAATDSQNILDNSHKKEVRLRRASISSMIPSSTGSAKDIGKLFSELAGKIICQAIRIPLPTVSLINLVVEVDKKTSKDEVNGAFEKAEKTDLSGILEVAKNELVSKDFTGNPHSSIVDPYLTNVLNGNLVQVSAWYDNEWGYASRLVDLVSFIGKKSQFI